MRNTIPLAILAVCAVLGPQAVQAQSTLVDSSRAESPAGLADALLSARMRDGDTVYIAVSSSGGISLGAYQAGVNWMLLEAARASRRDLSYLGAPIQLVALSGASAGNINSLLSAISWCQDPSEVLSPERSLFWATWIPVGYRQLVPDARHVRAPEYGVVDRQYFRDSLLPLVAASMQPPRMPTPRPGCDVPIGVTLNKLAADSMAVFRGLQVRVQRFVTSLRFVTSPEGGAVLLQSHPRFRSSRAVGKHIMLASARGDTLAWESVGRAVQASSSVPYVFAPVQLEYFDAVPADTADRRCPASEVHPDGCRVAKRARFVDGGTIDNNPIGLALVMLNEHLAWDEQYRSARRLSAAGFLAWRDSVQRRTRGDPGAAEVMAKALEVAKRQKVVLYISPGAMRSEEERATTVEVEQLGGIPALGQFAANTWSSASHYELQSLSRARALSPDLLQGGLDATSRALPIFGETYKHFGAFLGRPFREYDFYVGMYDGMHYLAQARCIAFDGMKSQECVDVAMTEVARGLRLGCVAPALLRTFYLREHARSIRGTLSDASSDCADGSAEAQRLVLLQHVDRALAGRQARSNCRSQNPVRNSLCIEGLLEAFEKLGRDSALQAAVDMEKLCTAAAKGSTGAPPQAACAVDSLYAAIITDPTHAVTNILFEVVDRLGRIEDGLGRNKADNYAGEAELLSALAFSKLQAARRGFDVYGPSFPANIGLGDGAFWAKLIPSSLTNKIGASGFELGWQGRYYFGSRVSLVLPAYLGWSRLERPQPGQSGRQELAHLAHSDIGLGTAFAVNRSKIDECQVSAGVPNVERRDDPLSISVYRARCDVLLRKLMVGVMYHPRSPLTRKNWTASVGVSDLAGMLYWIFR